MEKEIVRQGALLARKKAHEFNGDDIDISLLIDAVFSFPKVEIISGYMPIKTEISPLEAMKKLVSCGKRLCLPVVQSAGKPLFFKEWTPVSSMVRGAFGAQIPENGLLLNPELLIVPLVAFDANLNRLGYGGGYYDRIIQKLENKKKILKIGLAFSFQRVKKVPIFKYDKKLDYILTEKLTLK